MPIDAQTIAATAALAKLDIGHKLTESEAGAALEKITREINTIFSYIDVLKEADTEGAEPVFSVLEEAPGPREDLPQSGRGEEILAQAPDRSGNFFAVPKIL